MLDKNQIVIARNTQLSNNFTLFELIKSDSHPELVEWPTQQIIDELKTLCETILQPIRDQWGPLHINSGWRNTELNARVGGVSNSIHQVVFKTVLLGAAADIVPARAALLDVFNWAWENVPAARTMILYRKPNVTATPFIHIDNRRNQQGRAKLEKFGANDYRPYKE